MKQHMTRLPLFAVGILAALGLATAVLATPVVAEGGTGHISGTVTDAGTFAGLGGILVNAYTSPEALWNNEDPVATTTTESDGSYILPDVPIGSYMVQFNSIVDSHYNPQYYEQYYNGLSYVRNNQPNYVAVAEGATTPGVDAHLTKLIATTTALTSSANPSNIGTAVTLTATVSEANGGGMMIYKDNGQLIDGCGFTLFTGTTATCTYTFTTAGEHTISAQFNGDAVYAPSDTELHQVVRNAPSHISQCKHDGWRVFTEPTFKNQGQCIVYVLLGHLPHMWN